LTTSTTCSSFSRRGCCNTLLQDDQQKYPLPRSPASPPPARPLTVATPPSSNVNRTGTKTNNDAEGIPCTVDSQRQRLHLLFAFLWTPRGPHVAPLSSSCGLPCTAPYSSLCILVDSHGPHPTPLSALPLTPMNSTYSSLYIPVLTSMDAGLCFLLLPSLASSHRRSLILSCPLSCHARPFILPIPTNPSQSHHTTTTTMYPIASLFPPRLYPFLTSPLPA
jgi:hypothetical protein